MSREPSSEEVKRYSEILADVKVRLRLAAIFFDAIEPDRLNVEVAALQLRIALESIALGSLVSNASMMDEMRGAIEKKDPEQARKLLRKVNRHYWPTPVTKTYIGPGTSSSRLEDVPEGFVREEDYGRWLGKTSEWLHGRSTWKPPLDVSRGISDMRQLHNQLVRLLDNHIVRLANSTWMMTGQMDSSPTGLHAQGEGTVQVALFERRGDAP